MMSLIALGAIRSFWILLLLRHDGSATLWKSETLSLYLHKHIIILICESYISPSHLQTSSLVPSTETLAVVSACVSGVNTRGRRVSFRDRISAPRPVVTLSTIEWGTSDTQPQYVRASQERALMHARSVSSCASRSSSPPPSPHFSSPLGGVHSSTLIAVRVPEGRWIMPHKLPEINPTLRPPSMSADIRVDLDSSNTRCNKGSFRDILIASAQCLRDCSGDGSYRDANKVMKIADK